MRRLKRTGLPVIAAVLLTLAQCPVAAIACPNCKEAVSASTSEVSETATGYNWSVLFLLAVPFSLFGTGAFMIRRAARRGMLPEW